MRLAAAKGLGDALYLRAAALHLMKIGQPFDIYTGWPEVFVGIPNIRPLSEADNSGGDLCHVAACNCRNPEIMRLDHFTNAYRRAGIEGPVELQIGWKVQNMVGVGSDDLKISHQFIGSGKIPRFLAIAMRKDVLSEYQDLFTMLGWQTGFLVPRFMGEASWFDWDSTPGDKLMVGSRGETCQVAIVRNGELLLIRSIDGDPDRFEDEVYRFAMYYRDRIAESQSDARVTSVIANGAIDEQKLSNAIAEALGAPPTLLSPVPDLLDADASTVGPLLVAAAGVATQAWSRS